MNSNNISDSAISLGKKYDCLVKEVEIDIIFVRDFSIIRRAKDKLDTFLIEIINAKKISQGNQENETSNFLLSIESALKILINEANMLLALKNHDPDSAWTALVNAQSSARDAIRAHKAGRHIEEYINKLKMYEVLLFPKPTFTSIGIVVKKSVCSICKLEYGYCNHVLGYAYNGEFCYEIIDEIAELNHIAIVDEPADRHARIIWTGSEGVKVNYFTKLQETVNKE